MKSIEQWKKLANDIMFTTKEGKEKKPHSRVHMWDFPHQRFGLKIAEDTLERVKNKRPIDKRRSHPLRSLGLLNLEYKLTNVGIKFINTKEDRIKKFIIENQCKKWHYPNPTLTRASSLAIEFNIFPFWAYLSFMLSVKKELESDILYKEEAIFTILSAKNYADLSKRLEFLTDFRDSNPDRRTQILSEMRIKESLDFLEKGVCYRLFSSWTRYFLVDSNDNLILNKDIIKEGHGIVKLFDNFLAKGRLPPWDSQEYIKLLYSEQSFENYFTGKEYVDIEDSFPDLSKIKADFIDLKIDKEKLKKIRRKREAYPRTVDFEKEMAERKKIGDLGEEIVLKKEEEMLERHGKKDLCEQIEQISKIDTSAGYDILSYELNGQEKRIEVKSTASSPSETISFFMTINEYRKARKLENYYIYIVFDVTSNNPKIWRLKNPFAMLGKGVFLTPFSFRVIISISGIT